MGTWVLGYLGTCLLICSSAYLLFCSSVHLSICLVVCLSGCLFGCLSIRSTIPLPSIRFDSIHTSFMHATCLVIYPSIYPFTSFFLFSPLLWACVCVFIFLFIFIFFFSPLLPFTTPFRSIHPSVLYIWMDSARHAFTFALTYILDWTGWQADWLTGVGNCLFFFKTSSSFGCGTWFGLT